MKKNYVFIVLLALAVQLQAQNALYPGVNALNLQYSAIFTPTPPVIDGNPTDEVWSLAPWMPAQTVTPLDAVSWPSGTTPVAPEGAFSGTDDTSLKYKILWDNTTYYVLFQWKDDVVVYSDTHTGYPGSGQVAPPFYTGPTMTASVPAIGREPEDPMRYQAWRLDQITFWMAPYSETLVGGATYARNTAGLYHTFYPGQINSTNPQSVLHSTKHTGGQNHIAKSAISLNTTENTYYIEFRDTTWATLWNTVSGVNVTGYVPAIGDKFLLSGENNDADGTSNRRDYANYISALNTNPVNNMSEAMVITLAGSTGITNPSSARSFEIYPNPNSSGTLRLSRAANIDIFNLAGKRVLSSNNLNEVNISSLQPGVYMVKDNEGNVRKLIRK
jgi:hypothetical protein